MVAGVIRMAESGQPLMKKDILIGAGEARAVEGSGTDAHSGLQKRRIQMVRRKFLLSEEFIFTSTINHRFQAFSSNKSIVVASVERFPLSLEF